MHLRTETLTEQNDAELTSFLDRLGADSPAVLGYHYPFYRRLIEAAASGKPTYFGARLDGELVGFLPSFTTRSEAGAVYSSLPFFGPNAGVLTTANGPRGEIHRELLALLLSEAREADALSCSVYTPFLFNEFGFYDAAMPGAHVIPKFTQYLDLQSTVWSSAIQYDLRKAKKFGVEISQDITADRIDAFYSLYRMNCIDYGIPIKPRQCVQILFGDDVIGKHSDAYFALRDGEMIGGLVMVWGPQTASYYIPCTLPSARTLQPGTVLIDRAVADARRRGIRYWNWESSPARDSGVFQFKKKWGSLESGYRIYVNAFKAEQTFKSLGKDGIQKQFPYYFVYSFDRL